VAKALVVAAVAVTKLIIRSQKRADHMIGSLLFPQ